MLLSLRGYKLAMTDPSNHEEDTGDLFGRTEEEKRLHRAENKPKFVRNRAVAPAEVSRLSKKKLLLFISPLAAFLLFLCFPTNASKILTYSALMQRNGKHYESAIQLCDVALKLNPASTDSYIARASINEDCQHYDLAIADYTRAVIMDPQRTRIYFDRGLARYKIHDYKGSIADFDETIKAQPGNSDAYVRRGIAHARLGEYDAAIADYDQATKSDPTNSEALYNKGWVMDLQYDQTMENDNSSGNVGAQKSTLSKQVDDLSKRLELAKTDPQLHYNRGLACLKLRKTKEAIADFNEAIRLSPQMASAYVNRGLAYSSQNQFDKAIADYTASLAVSPQNASAWYRRGLAYDHIAKYSAALADYQMAARLNPSGAKRYASLAALDERRLNPSTKKAASAPVQIRPKASAAARVVTSASANVRGAASPAVTQASTASSARSLSDDFAAAWNYTNQFKHAEAVAAWSVVLRERPNNQDAAFLYHREKGIVLNLEGKFAQSVEELNAAAAVYQPKNAFFYKWRARSYHGLGDNNLAIADINEGLRKNPQDSGLLDLRQTIYGETGRKGASSQSGIASGSRSSFTPDSSNGHLPGVVGTAQSLEDQIRSDWQKAQEYDQSRQFEQALYYYKLVLAYHPRPNVSRPVYRAMGAVYGKMKDYEKALEMYSASIKLGSRDIDIYKRRGNIYLALGQGQQALNDFNVEISLKPMYAAAYRDRSKAYKAIGRADLAAADETRASELNARQ